jgi:uncharacterized protein YjiS (DUF1127 family)
MIATHFAPISSIAASTRGASDPQEAAFRERSAIMTMSSAAKTRLPGLCPRSGMIGKVADVVREWRDGNRKRRHGFRLDDQTIRDIGLTRLEVTYREATMSLYKRAAHPWS